MLRDPVGGVWKLTSVVCSPIGRSKLRHVHTSRCNRQDEPANRVWSVEGKAGRDDATHGLGHQVDGTINRDVDKTDKIVNAVDVGIMGLVAQAGPPKKHLVPRIRQSFRDRLPKPGRAAGAGQEQDFLHFRETCFQGDPQFGALFASGWRCAAAEIACAQLLRCDHLLCPPLP
jgi:hypothetical protein